MNKILVRWNSLDPASAAREVLPCCGSQAWAAALASRRPITDEGSLIDTSSSIWLDLSEDAWQEAFNSHPRIGERRAEAHATEESLRWSVQEQSTALSEDDAAKLALEKANQRYEQKFGRIFIVCATGKTAPEILAILEARMKQDAATELREAAEQQRQITELRLRRWLESNSMGISTHILDTALGRPATGVPITLARMTDGVWSLLNDAVTDADGRCKHLLPAAQALQPGMYRIRFETDTYYRRGHFEGLYPYIEIVFTVDDAGQHYHIPLLLTANGYTTYRGS